MSEWFEISSMGGISSAWVNLSKITMITIEKDNSDRNYYIHVDGVKVPVAFAAQMSASVTVRKIMEAMPNLSIYST